MRDGKREVRKSVYETPEGERKISPQVGEKKNNNAGGMGEQRMNQPLPPNEHGVGALVSAELERKVRENRTLRDAMVAEVRVQSLGVHAAA